MTCLQPTTGGYLAIAAPKPTEKETVLNHMVSEEEYMAVLAKRAEKAADAMAVDDTETTTPCDQMVTEGI